MKIIKYAMLAAFAFPVSAQAYDREAIALSTNIFSPSQVTAEAPLRPDTQSLLPITSCIRELNDYNAKLKAYEDAINPFGSAEAELNGKIHDAQKQIGKAMEAITDCNKTASERAIDINLVTGQIKDLEGRIKERLSYKPPLQVVELEQQLAQLRADLIKLNQEYKENKDLAAAYVAVIEIYRRELGELYGQLAILVADFEKLKADRDAAKQALDNCQRKAANTAPRNIIAAPAAY